MTTVVLIISSLNLMLVSRLLWKLSDLDSGLAGWFTLLGERTQRIERKIDVRDQRS